MKWSSLFLGFILFFQTQSFAGLDKNLDKFSIQVGIGYDYCHPNSEGLKTCESRSPNFKRIIMDLNEAADGGAFYGFETLNGTFQNIGYFGSLQILRYQDPQMADTLTLILETWSLSDPDNRYKVQTEVFLAPRETLNRTHLIGHPIGTEDDYANIILGLKN